MSDCSVCIGGGDIDDYPEFSDCKIVKARKIHKCSECHRDIAIGQQYERFSFKFDGHMYCEKTCLDCRNIRIGLTCEGESPPVIGELWSDVIANFPHLKSTACLAKIPTASAKAYFLERWRQWKFGGAQ